MTISLRALLAGSVRSFVAAHGFPSAISLRELAAAMTPVRWRFELTPSSCSGWCDLIVSPDGRVEYSGHIHNSGLVDIRYCTITSVQMPGGPMLVGRQGSVGGTLGLDSRDDDWHQSGHSDVVSRNWAALRAASGAAKTQTSASIGITELLTTVVGGGSGFWVLSLP